MYLYNNELLFSCAVVYLFPYISLKVNADLQIDVHFESLDKNNSGYH